MINLNVLGSASGTDAEYASSLKTIQMPKIIEVNKTTDPITLEGLVDGSVRVNAIGTNGTMGKKYIQSTAPTATEFGIADTNKLSLPTDPEATRFVVKYERTVESGVKIVNQANKYPKTVCLTLKCLGIEPCTPDVIRVIVDNC